jgi:hypothetical protein
MHPLATTQYGFIPLVSRKKSFTAWHSFALGNNRSSPHLRSSPLYELFNG